MSVDVGIRERMLIAQSRAEEGPSPRAALVWLAGGAAALFAVSFLASDVLELHHDLYLLVYVTIALLLLAAFARRSGASLSLLRTNLAWSLALGALVGVGVVRQVMAQPGTEHPGGGFYVFELLWRGLVYGSVDALVLAVFPAVVAMAVLRGNRTGLRRKAAFAGLVVVLSLGVSAAYHAGYDTYRGGTMQRPLIGTVMWDVPAALTGNPVGAVVAHAAVHSTAVVHQYYGGENHLLPPELTPAYAENLGGTAAPLAAVAWVAVVGTSVLLLRRRWMPADRTRVR